MVSAMLILRVSRLLNLGALPPELHKRLAP